MANLNIPVGTKIAFRAGKTKDQAVADKIANQIANLNLCTTKELYINGERVGLTDAEATKLAGSASSGDLSALQTRVAAVEQKNTQQDTSISTNTQNITALTGRVGAVEQKNGQQDTSISTNTQNITALTGRVSTAEGKINTHTSEIAQLKSEDEALGENIDTLQSFVTVPFDGFETSDATIQEMGLQDPASIVYVVPKKRFAAKDAAGKFYDAWTAKDGRSPKLYQTIPTSPHTKKLYVYKGEIYDMVTNRPVPLALMLGKPITVGATGNDETRAISQKLFTTEIGKYVPLTTYNALAARVAALEAQLKLA